MYLFPLASCLPWVPEKGTVGASGDLAPLAHLALGMMGEGKMWSPECGWGEARYVSVRSVEITVQHATIIITTKLVTLKFIYVEIRSF